MSVLFLIASYYFFTFGQKHYGSRLQNNKKRRGGKREGAGRKKSHALAKITREINQKQWRANHHYIYLENRVFSTRQKEPSQTIRTLFHGRSVLSSDEDEKSEYQLLHIFRAVFDFHTGKKCSEYLDLFCIINDMKLSRTMAYKTRQTVNRFERKQLHFLTWCQNDRVREKPRHRAREA